MTYSENATILSQSLPEQNESQLYTSPTKSTTNSVYSAGPVAKNPQKHIQNNINVGELFYFDQCQVF